MPRTLTFLCWLTTLLISGCNTTESLTREELAIQNAADEQVALILFERELEGSTSYNVHKNGHVVIKFKEDVWESDYTAAVAEMRKNPAISGVTAKQGGRAICVLRHGR